MECGRPLKAPSKTLISTLRGHGTCNGGGRRHRWPDHGPLRRMPAIMSSCWTERTASEGVVPRKRLKAHRLDTDCICFIVVALDEGHQEDQPPPTRPRLAALDRLHAVNIGRAPSKQRSPRGSTSQELRQAEATSSSPLLCWPARACFA